MASPWSDRPARTSTSATGSSNTRANFDQEGLGFGRTSEDRVKSLKQWLDFGGYDQ